MVIRAYIFVLTLFAYGCHAQNSVKSNEIFASKDNLIGVKSKEGNLLIDPIYDEIRIVFDNQKLTLPPKESRQRAEELEYYLVRNSSNQKALFNQNGELVFGFVDCQNLIIDQHTETVVVTKIMQENTRPRSYLYHLNGDLLFEDSFENIGYINNVDLIVLVVEDGSNKELYLFNPFENKRLGPYDHLNIYNEDMSSFGMTASEFAIYKDLNIIKLRREVDNDYLWGAIDAKGNEILPLEYRNLRIFLDPDKNHPAYKRAIKPEGVEFLFMGAHLSKPSTSIYFDRDFVKYEFKISVEKGEYKIERI